MPNNSLLTGSVTLWIHQMQSGDPDAINFLWHRYFASVVKLARQKLKNYPRRMADEEDIAASVMHCLCSGVDRGKFPDLENREDLWCLLVALTRHMSADLLRRHTSKKRGRGNVRGHSALDAKKRESYPAGFDQLVSETPTPESLVEMNEGYLRLMSLLEDDSQKRIAQWKLECYTNEEIANRLNISISTVERRLKQIREIWFNELS